MLHLRLYLHCTMELLTDLEEEGSRHFAWSSGPQVAPEGRRGCRSVSGLRCAAGATSSPSLRANVISPAVTQGEALEKYVEWHSQKIYCISQRRKLCFEKHPELGLRRPAGPAVWGGSYHAAHFPGP